MKNELIALLAALFRMDVNIQVVAAEGYIADSVGCACGRADLLSLR